MPQAAQWLLDKWGGYAGVADDKAMNYLTERGWRLTKNWCLLKPSFEHEITDLEDEAAMFLQDEWEYGIILTDEESYRVRS